MFWLEPEHQHKEVSEFTMAMSGSSRSLGKATKQEILFLEMGMSECVRAGTSCCQLHQSAMEMASLCTDHGALAELKKARRTCRHGAYITPICYSSFHFLFHYP